MLFIITEITGCLFFSCVLGYYRGETVGFLNQATFTFSAKVVSFKSGEMYCCQPRESYLMM